ncbi:hypothetical protein HDU93_006518 [Gonapodya sp. JEL0774]|nr:hypothetical protein HDU93_006518 [Gonapodya sp. JEL0774]
MSPLPTLPGDPAGIQIDHPDHHGGHKQAFAAGLLIQRNELKLRVVRLQAMLGQAQSDLVARDDLVARAILVAAQGSNGKAEKQLSNATTQTQTCSTSNSCPHVSLLARLSRQLKTLKVRLANMEKERDIARDVAGGMARWGLADRGAPNLHDARREHEAYFLGKSPVAEGDTTLTAARTMSNRDFDLHGAVHNNVPDTTQTAAGQHPIPDRDPEEEYVDEGGAKK